MDKVFISLEKAEEKIESFHKRAEENEKRVQSYEEILNVFEHAKENYYLAIEELKIDTINGGKVQDYEKGYFNIMVERNLSKAITIDLLALRKDSFRKELKKRPNEWVYDKYMDEVLVLLNDAVSEMITDFDNPDKQDKKFMEFYNCVHNSVFSQEDLMYRQDFILNNPVYINPINRMFQLHDKTMIILEELDVIEPCSQRDVWKKADVLNNCLECMDDYIVKNTMSLVGAFSENDFSELGEKAESVFQATAICDATNKLVMKKAKDMLVKVLTPVVEEAMPVLGAKGKEKDATVNPNIG
ncbi:MAG: hypothetical protein OIF36_00670 [Alphaproteobacteria bacterium]|nr:hypothetical protein [Alphaproteobacteria bacterium]